MNRIRVTMFGLLLVAGCGIHLDPKVPSGLGTQREGSVNMGAGARGMPSRAGWGTFTVFAIPVAPVRVTNGPGEQIVMAKLKETLAGAGYRSVEGGVPGETPVLECDVKRFRFRNYTYFFPLVFTWGGVDLDLKLVGREGQPLWQRSYRGKNFNLAYSFTRAANRSMEQVLEQFGRDAAGEEFFQACCARPAAVAVTP